MFKLINNELTKYFFRPFTYIFFLFLFIVMLSVFSLAPKVFDYDYGGDREYSDNWKQEAKSDIVKYAKTLDKAQKSKDTLNKDILMKKEFLPNEIRRLNAHLDKGIHPPAPNNVFSKIFNATSFLPVVLVFLIIYSGSIVSQEFQKGTIKSLLISSYSRNYILLSKYLSVIIVACTSVLVMYLFMGGISLFTSHINPNGAFIYYNLNTHNMTEISFMSEIPKFIISDIFFAIIIATVAFAFSTLLLNSSIAISISLGTYFLSELVIDFLSDKYSFVKWLWFTNWDMNAYSGIMNSKVIESMSSTHSLIYNLVLIVVFLTLSFVSFSKRDINI